uniref:protein FAR1-RELATED SEQUENCE 5-like n=1 Tax=Erigeron canadensis TaxID=72917 RepID=UPI001CB979B1|nr:protein FAR1-RELATED SEQUENCE 5-like [Erigeron canadensis]
MESKEESVLESKEHDVSDDEIIEDEEGIFADEEEDNTVYTVNVTPITLPTTTIIQTPGGSEFFAPIVDPRMLPVKGNIYGTLENCEAFYKEYASHAGFDVRKSCQKTTRSGWIKQKYYLCSRQGTPKNVSLDTLETKEKQIRKSTHECTGCRARIRFDWIFDTESYRVGLFEPHHNHEMLRQEYRHLSRTERQLKYAEQIFVYNAHLANIGPTKAHQLYSNMKGSYQNVNGTVDDFRNWKRDLHVFINESDSQMLVNKMEERREYIPGFSFEYILDDSQLHSLFWADEVARVNYEEFSDIMSFDATY